MFVAPVYVSSEAEGVYRKIDIGLGVFCQWYIDAFHPALEISWVRGKAVYYSGEVWA